MSVRLRLTVIFFFVLSVATAQAEELARASASNEALVLGHRGLEHYRAKRFALAEESFREAESLAHSPVFLLYRARSQRELGQLLSARKLLQTCTEEEITPATPQAWKIAVDEAEIELKRLGAEVPTVSVTLTGGVILPVELRAGSQAIQLEHSGADWELDPGIHEVIARDASGTEVALPLLLQRGKNSKLEFHFPEVRAFEPLSANMPSVPVRPYRRGAHSAFILGASGLVFSAVAGTIAWSEAERVKRNCDGTTCRPEDEERAQNARRWANLSTVGVAVGAIGVGAGFGLLFYPTSRGGNVEMNVAF